MKIPSNSTNVVRRRTSVKRADLAEKVRSGELLPEQARHIAVTDVLGTLPGDLLRELAELAEIPGAPPSRREWFSIAVLNALFDYWDGKEDIHTNSVLKKNKSFARAIDALKYARQALAQIDESCRRAFFLPVAYAEQGIDDFLFVTSGELEPKRPVRQRGRPTGTVGDPPSRKFVFKLLESADLHGGHLTFQKDPKGGTLIEVLKKLAPYLPEGVAPHELSSATLQRIVDAYRERHALAQKLDNY
jgi:hypothetical protein